jgi:hypothetical protein
MDSVSRPLESPEFASDSPVERQWGRLSWRKYKDVQRVSTRNDWRSGRDSNPVKAKKNQ